MCDQTDGHFVIKITGIIQIHDITLQSANETRDSVVNIKTTFSSIREAIIKSTKIRTFCFALLNGMMTLEISKLLFRSSHIGYRCVRCQVIGRQIRL